MSSLYKQQLNDWKATLDVKADTVFDIGGAQDKLQGKTYSWNVRNYVIIDLETPHIQTTPVDIAHDMNTPWTRDEKADAIFCLGVFDYVIEPGIAMRNVKEMLKDDGYAWIEFPLFYGHHEPLMDEGCRYSEGCINKLAKHVGLKITDIIRKQAGNPHLLQFMREDGQRLSKNYNYHNTVGFIVRFEK